MKPEEIKEFMQAVARARWDMDYEEFSQALENYAGGLFTDKWAREQWEAFQKLHTALSNFSANVLAAIVNSPAATQPSN